MSETAPQGQPARNTPTRDLLHTGMWTLLGLMGMGLALVPILKPDVLWTSLFFGWSNVMVAYMVYRMVQDIRRKEARDEPQTQVAPPLVSYTYVPAAQERPRIRVRAPGESSSADTTLEPCLR